MSVSKEIAKKLNTNSSRLFFPNKEPVTIVVFYLKLKICLESNKKAQLKNYFYTFANNFILSQKLESEREECFQGKIIVLFEL